MNGITAQQLNRRNFYRISSVLSILLALGSFIGICYILFITILMTSSGGDQDVSALVIYVITEIVFIVYFVLGIISSLFSIKGAISLGTSNEKPHFVFSIVCIVSLYLWIPGLFLLLARNSLKIERENSNE